ncbi:OLC1v1030976C2 [Oldenlandia corymbosa var. corymbosa]|uniref:OLC1v1030976C2 n=1 Tax=Oldenlandia corymbosa var. corymbosa TaxID=529605 RepID=A0AAV1CHH0_OLDCO|nr:OLC1v1030976C2 [Oldenlandia corymbosa var. corymbosa]
METFSRRRSFPQALNPLHLSSIAIAASSISPGDTNLPSDRGLPPVSHFQLQSYYGSLEFSFCSKWVGKLLRNSSTIGRLSEVMIIRGKDKGETGTIKRVIRSQNRVIVEGKNLVKKHIKQGQGHEGGIFTVEAPLHVSNVQVVDPVTGKPCKVGIRYLEDGSKVRVARGIGASGSIIPRPEILKIRTTPRPTVAGPKDTPMDVVLERTYDPKTGLGMPDLMSLHIHQPSKKSNK